MRSENKDLGGNVFQIMRLDHGGFDLVCSEKGEGWYIETIIGSVVFRSETYPHLNAAQYALKEIQQKNSPAP